MDVTQSMLDPVSELKRKLEEYKVEAVCGRKYIQVQKLIAWMTTGVPNTNVDRLLFACNKVDFAIDSRKLARGADRCLLIFSILVELGEGSLMHHLRKFDTFKDSSLPIPLAFLESVSTFKQKPGLAHRFNEAQWKYCPLRFELTEEREIAPDRIVPICEKTLIKEGGTSYINEIFVQEEFVDIALRETVPDSRYDDSKFGTVYNFALKTYKHGNEAMYDNETHAFRGLNGNKGLVKCLFHYSHIENEDAGKISYHLVLEYGERDLHEYFHYYLPPVLEDEQFGFWSDLFLVANTVRDIHVFERPSVNGGQKYFGWHNDIKPDNILNVRKEFKLADPGFARFEKQDVNGKDATEYPGGTSTFGAPECYVWEHQLSRVQNEPHAPVRRSIDIWSLGCVFSVAATWMVYGKYGIEQFKKFREQAICDTMVRQQLSQEQKVKLKKGDYFHDSENILEAVPQWHEYLLRGMRRNDILTEKVLHLVEKSMLLSDPASRITAQHLCKELQNIRDAAEAALPPPVLDSIQEALHRTEEETVMSMNKDALAASSDSDETIRNLPTGIIDRGRRMSSRNSAALLKPSVQTSHRSKASGSFSKHVVNPSRVLRAGVQGPTTSRLIVKAPLQQQGAIPIDKTEARYPKDPTPLEPVSETTSATQSSTLLVSPRQTLTGLSATSSTSSFRNLKSKFRKKPRGDPELIPHFQNRDIVFVLDNGTSMKKHWEAVKSLLFQLVSKAQYVDKDGMDLKFTISDTNFKASNVLNNFVWELNNQNHVPRNNIETNMSTVLGPILQKFLDSFTSRKKDSARKMTIIVLTDGKWGGMTNKLAVDNKIVEFCQQLKKHRHTNLEDDTRSLSIQFVQFGDDPQATRRLRRLDDELKFRGVPDIVDHKPADADLLMILTGSVYDLADADGEETNDLELTTSPDQLGEESAPSGHAAIQRTPSKRSRSADKRPEFLKEPSALDLVDSVAHSRPTDPRSPRVTPAQPPKPGSAAGAPTAPSVHVSSH